MCSIQTIATPSARSSRIVVMSSLHLRLRQPAGDLVEQEHPGSGREGARELEPLALEKRQPACGRVCLVEQAGAIECLDARLPEIAVGAAAPVGRADQHVLVGGELGERTRDLEGPRDPRAAVLVPGETCHVAAAEDDPPRVGAHRPTDDVQERRLAGAVRPHDPEGLAVLEREARPRSAPAETRTTSRHGRARREPSQREGVRGSRCGSPTATKTT